MVTTLSLVEGLFHISRTVSEILCWPLAFGAIKRRRRLSMAAGVGVSCCSACMWTPAACTAWVLLAGALKNGGSAGVLGACFAMGASGCCCGLFCMSMAFWTGAAVLATAAWFALGAGGCCLGAWWISADCSVLTWATAWFATHAAGCGS